MLLYYIIEIIIWYWRNYWKVEQVIRYLFT